MISVFVLVCVFSIWSSYMLNRKILNATSILIFPYLVIVLINNFYMIHSGFYLISNDTLGMLAAGIFSFVIGGFLGENKKIVREDKVVDMEGQLAKKFVRFNIKGCGKYVAVVETLCWLRFIFIVVSHGISYLSTEDYSGTMTGGVLGHFLLTLYPLVPILFLYWLNNKKKVIYLILTISNICLLFLSMVKYHSIGMLVLLYLFCSLENKKYVKKGAFILAGLAIALFIGNYFITFFIRGTTSLVSQSYYLNHLWNYIAGSLIYDNRIFTYGVRSGVSIFYKLGSFLFAFPNMFLNAILGLRISPHEAVDFYAVGTNGEKGNVVDAIGYLYPSDGSAVEMVLWIAILIALGFVFTKIYNHSMKTNLFFHISISILLTFFIFFSFFGTFYVSPVPWEILIWSALVPKLFDGRIRLTFGNRRFTHGG